MKLGWKWSAALAGTLVAPALAAGAESNIVLPRPGQVGVGAQGTYGTLTRGGDLGSLFSSGGGIAIRMRYRMRYERALGLSFEGQQFDPRTTGAAGDTLKQLSVILSGFEVYQMFGTRTRTARMVSVGAGLVQPSVKLRSDETTFPEDGVYVSLGAGVEHFFWRTWAYDLSARYHALFQHGTTTHDLHVGLGLIFYAAY